MGDPKSVKSIKGGFQGDLIKANANGKLVMKTNLCLLSKVKKFSSFYCCGGLGFLSRGDLIIIQELKMWRFSMLSSIVVSLASGMPVPPWAAVCHVEWKLWAHPGGVARTWHMAPSSSQDRKTKWNPLREALPKVVNSRPLVHWLYCQSHNFSNFEKLGSSKSKYSSNAYFAIKLCYRKLKIEKLLSKLDVLKIFY